MLYEGGSLRAHAGAFKEFDSAVRACFESFTGLDVDEVSWMQATLSTRSSGLGLQSTLRHSAAATLASHSACNDLCCQFDATYTYNTSDELTSEGAALRPVNDSVKETDKLNTDSTQAYSQQALSRALDAMTFDQLTDESTTSTQRRAHLHLLAAGSAGSWLHALPSENLGLQVEPQLFVAMLQRWLRLPFAALNVLCPMCNGILDKYGDHALVCGCGGDRTK